MSVFRDILVCGKQLRNRPLVAGFDSKQSILGKARAVGKAEKTFVSQIQDLITMWHWGLFVRDLPLCKCVIKTREKDRYRNPRKKTSKLLQTHHNKVIKF